MNAPLAHVRIVALGVLCLVAIGRADGAEPAATPPLSGHPVPAAISSEKAAHPEPGSVESEVCRACKTVILVDSIHVSQKPVGARVRGFKHDGALCRRSIMAVEGATVDCMLKDRPTCGADASHCRAAIQTHASRL